MADKVFYRWIAEFEKGPDNSVVRKEPSRNGLAGV
jgi:hypothetical protein